jgi:glycine betaine/proline transport system substrate-binding protein
MRWGPVVLVLSSLWAGVSLAAEPERCRTVRMSDPGWSDIAATNGVAGALLTALGYRQHVDLLAVPLTYHALAHNEIDVFLGNWMPAQQALIDPPLHEGAIELLAVNLDDGKFTLAVPDYVAAAGVHGFEDLARFDDRFGRHIYGIGAGAPANESILRMLDAKDYGLGDWELIESSEQGMLAQLDRMQRRKQWIVFLAWEPHPMNAKFPIVYLSGGERYFGPDFGRTTINTVTRRNYADECPNAGRLFRQLHFQAAQEDDLMQEIDRRKEDPKTVALRFLAQHRDRLAGWLDGVKTWDGRDGLAAVELTLGRE